jgi:GNAT superfamily N-acetyltransferase
MSDGITLVPYRAEYREAFERLNRLWLKEHAILEEADLDYLREPEQRILAGGGEVFFALDGATVVGTCAAIRMSPTTWELAKLSVDPSARGRGLGRRLCGAVIEYARGAGASEVVLTSNSALVDAIRLYESLGFRHGSVPANVRYVSVDVFMRLLL